MTPLVIQCQHAIEDERQYNSLDKHRDIDTSDCHMSEDIH